MSGWCSFAETKNQPGLIKYRSPRPDKSYIDLVGLYQAKIVKSRLYGRSFENLFKLITYNDFLTSPNLEKCEHFHEL